MISATRAVGLLTVFVLALSLTACTGKPSASSSTAPVSRRPPSPIDPQAAAGQAAVAAYRGMWRAYAAAGAGGATFSPDLARYASDEALDALLTALRQVAADGLLLVGDVVPSPQIHQLMPSSAPNTAVIIDCLDTRNSKRVKASPGGPVFSDSPGGFRRVTATVTAMNGMWKVTLLSPEAVGTCHPG